jgi:phosphatidylserine decarboxylase
MNIHKEGRFFLVGFLAVILLMAFFMNLISMSKQSIYVVLAILGSLFLFCLQFFRNPTVRILKNPTQILAPADGKVVVIEEIEEPEYLHDKRIQVSIFMSPIDKHINRNPVSGTIKYLKYHAGKYLVAWHPKASTENERTTIVYELKGGTLILIRQIAGALARRIRYYVHEHEKVEQGEEFGFIKFGSRVDVFIPVDAKILVSIGQKTEGGKTVLAELTQVRPNE